jgi:type IV pilus assembly protein PilW
MGIHVNKPNLSMRRESGFSLVELMVGMVIGLLAVVVMFQVFSVSESQRRTTTGSGDAQQNGVTALFLMERDVRMAGYGIAYFPLLGCNAKGYYRKTATAFNFTVVPVKLKDGGAHAPDELTFVYGNPDTYALPAPLLQPSNLTAGYFYVAPPRYQFTPGDILLAGEVTAAGPGSDCSIAQVTALPDIEAQLSNVFYTGGNYDDNGTTRVAQYSPIGPLAATYTKWNPTKSLGGRVFNLGPAPVAVTYKIVNNQLVASNAFTPGEDTPIADNIVQFQAQLGYAPTCQTGTVASMDVTTLMGTCTMDKNTVVKTVVDTTVLPGPAAVGQWADATPAAMSFVDWRKIVAVRFAVVARSTTPERPDSSGNCTTTITQPQWNATSPSTPLWVDADPDWKCYRYKTFELVVPLRNMLWYADPSGSPVPPV